MNRPGQPPQRPPNLGPSQGLGGPFRSPFPPSSAFGLPARTGLGQQGSGANTGFPAMPNTHRTPGQGMVLPSPSFLQQQQRTSGVTAAGVAGGGYPFGSGGAGGLQQVTQQHPSHQPTTLQGSLASQPPPNSLQQNANGPNGTANGGEGPLDPNDFPALGSNTNSGGNNTGNPSANSPATTFAQSYATQAGTGLIPPSAAGAQQAGGVPNVQSRDFTPDDFPALGGGSQTQQLQSQGQIQSSNTGSAGLGVGAQDGSSGHPPGLNGFDSQQARQQNMPPGLLNLTGVQRNMVAADVEKRATSKLSTWSGAAAAANGTTSSISGNANLNTQQLTPGQQQNGSLQPSGLPSVPPGASVPSPYPPNSQPNPNDPTSLSQNSSAAVPQTAAQQVLMSAADRWGLLGLLTSIKNADPDQNLLTIGTDLGTMGLDMQTQGSLFSSFITPWSDSSAAHAVEPDFHLPQCYNVNAPAPGPNKAQAFSEETLFYMFYAHPRDALQEVAAQELYQRNWRFNKELRLWLTKETGRLRHSKTVEGGAGEQGVFTYWDPDMWEKGIKEFTVMYSDLENKEPSGMTGGAGAGAGQGQAFAGSNALQSQGAQAQGQVGPLGSGMGLGGIGAQGLGRGSFPGLSMTAAAM